MQDLYIQCSNYIKCIALSLILILWSLLADYLLIRDYKCPHNVHIMLQSLANKGQGTYICNNVVCSLII